MAPVLADPDPAKVPSSAVRVHGATTQRLVGPTRIERRDHTGRRSCGAKQDRVARPHRILIPNRRGGRKRAWPPPPGVVGRIKAEEVLLAPGHDVPGVQGPRDRPKRAVRRYDVAERRRLDPGEA